MIIRRHPLAATLTCVWCLGVCGETYAATAWDLISPQSFDPHSRAARVAVASDLKTRIDRLVDLVQVQDRAEVDQLERDEAQLKATGSARGKSAVDLQLSVAYQHRKLTRLLAGIEDSLTCVINSQTEASEMHCWAVTSLALSDDEALRLALATLREKHRVPQNKDLPPLLRGPEVWYRTYARGILEYILVPYLTDAAAQK